MSFRVASGIVDNELPREEPSLEPELTPAPGEFEPSGLRSDSTNWGMGAHLAALSTLIGVPFGNIVGPLVVWLIKRKEDAYVERHAREALNFNISVTIYGIVLVAAGVVLLFVVVGLLLFVAAGVLFVVWLVLTVMAAVKAARGEPYTYPLTLRFIA